MERNIYLGVYICVCCSKGDNEFILKFYVFLNCLHSRSILMENNSGSYSVCFLWKIYKLNYTQPNMFFCVWIYTREVLTLS